MIFMRLEQSYIAVFTQKALFKHIFTCKITNYNREDDKDQRGKKTLYILMNSFLGYKNK